MRREMGTRLVKTHLCPPVRVRCVSKGWYYEFGAVCGTPTATYMYTPCGKKLMRFCAAVTQLDDFVSLPLESRCARCARTILRAIKGDK